MNPTAVPAELDRVDAALRSVIDPGLDLDVVALGLIYTVRGHGDRLEVDMTLTTPAAPSPNRLRRCGTRFPISR